MKTNKGFTLIEIMIVIAIIGILALVLVPKIGSMKDQAKLAGVDTNMRVVEAIAQGMLTSYNAGDNVDTGIIAFEEAIDTKLPSDVENPITNAAGKGTVTSVTGGTSAAFAQMEGTHLASATTPALLPPAAPADDTGKTLRGCVVYTTWTSADGAPDLHVTLYPYDENGQLVAAKVKTLNK